MSSIYDVCIVGLGGVGSACADYLVGLGLRVLGLEHFNCAHDRGSSHGLTRLFRVVSPSVVESQILDKVRCLWQELQHETSQPIYRQLGHLSLLPPSSTDLDEIIGRDEVERLDAAQVSELHPDLAIGDATAVYDPTGAILHPEAIVRLFCSRASDRGADIHFGEKVRSWTCDRDVVVETERGRYRAKHLVLSMGAWAAQMASPVAELAVHPSPVAWFRRRGPARDSLPTFTFLTERGEFYGCHVPGESVLKLGSPHLTPTLSGDFAERPRYPTASQLEPLAWFRQRHTPSLDETPARTSLCMSTHSPDKRFFVAPHPESNVVTVVAGLSGRGFKYLPAIARVVASHVVGETARGFEGAAQLWTRPGRREEKPQGGVARRSQTRTSRP